MFKIEIEVN